MKKSFILILSAFLIFPVLSQSNQDLEFLRNAISSGCLKNGNILTNSDKSRYVYRAITNTSKREVDFYPDMTYKFRDGSKSGKWTCPQLSGNSSNSSSRSSNKSSSNSTVTLHQCEWCGKKFTYAGFYIGPIKGEIYSSGATHSSWLCDEHFCSVLCANEMKYRRGPRTPN